MEYRYKALLIKQTQSDKTIALFAAPAVEIDMWAGVPQKKQFGSGEETVGFQREESDKRVDSLGEFCGNDENIIQNPLLCATRQISVATTRFEPCTGESGDTQDGELIIEIPDYSEYSMKDILGLVRRYIESRVPELAGKTPDENMVAKLKALAAEKGHFSTEVAIEENAPEVDADESEVIAEAEAALFEESHIIDFWQEVASRHEVIKLIENECSDDEFLGFQRDALVSYLRPVVLVDGQHRLRGALRAVETRMAREDIQAETENRIGGGEPASDVEKDILRREARRLPISLLLTDEPAEQVFQFVVVNQKATPIGRALLGTIVSTTLSNEEMESVAARLKNAGIELEESQAITYLARYPGSPFYDLVERGLAGDKSKDLLQWGVFASLVGIFRDLKGGKPYGYGNDYALAWKDKYLSSSAIVSGHVDAGYGEALLYWRKLDGPWRDVFIAFFSKIRDVFGNTTVQDAHNFWGRPRDSNLFNKISLTILAADFFQFLIETRKAIDSPGQISDLVDDWLGEVNNAYFARDWNLSGVKKDSTGIRNQWAYLWVEYRKNPTQLPQARMYRVPKGA